MLGPLKRAVNNESPMSDKLKLFDAEVAFDQDRSTNDLIIKRHQYIPDDFISDLKSNKMDSARAPTGEFMLALQVPTSVIEEMQSKYNFDAMNAPIKEIKAMLDRMKLDAFIATNKRL